MELVYLWVKDYKNIHKQGFNFSPRFECHYNDETNELTINENDDYIENFFGENINVTAIVGKNGSGKSSVLNAIINAKEDGSTVEQKYILVYSCGEQRYYHSNFNVDTSLGKNNDANFIIYLDRKDNDVLPINMGATPLSNPKKYRNAFLKYKEIDISKDVIINLLAIEIGKVDSSFKLSTFMYLPNKISIELKTPEELIGNFITHISKDRNEVERYFISLNDIEHQLLIIEYLRSSPITEDNILNNIKDKKNLNYSDKIKKIIELIGNKKELNINNLEEDEKNLYLRKNGLSHLLNFDLIDEKERYYNDLSHGEQIIFGQLLNLYFYTYQNNSGIFLFDEPEISLHPDWQKRYINEVITLLKKIEEQKHFVFTTHSPFLLSDIPKQNIIFLDKDENGNCKVVDGLKEKKQTFGANIHTLLSDSFFMKDGLMGEFAKGKINEIIDFHKEVEEENKKEKSNLEPFKTKYEIDKKRFWQTQSIIGEDYLKQVIKNHLRDIENILLGFDEAKKEEIDRLRAEANRLEQI